MRNINETKRQDFLYWEAYEAMDEYLEANVASCTDYLASATEEEKLDLGYVDMVCSSFDGALERLTLEYTAGAPIEEVKALYPAVVDAFEAWCVAEAKWYLAQPDTAPNLQVSDISSPIEIEDPASYLQVLCLLSLGVLFNEGAQLQRVAGLLWSERNSDAIVEELLYPFVPNAKRCDTLYHLDLYDHLLGAIWRKTPKERTACMKTFFKRWYKYFEGAHWHDAHLRFGQFPENEHWANYYGYWAFEAAALSYLYELDDSPWREHLLYPKDLVNWARRQGPPPKQYIPSASDRPIVPQAFPGDPCPIAGTWYAVHLGMKEVDMKLNEPMPGPKVGPSGMVIWYFKGPTA